MRTPCFETKANQRISALKAPGNFVVRHRIITALVCRKNPPFHFVGVRPADGGVYGSQVMLHYSVNYCQIFLAYYTCFHLAYESVLSKAVFCNQKQAGCIHVQPVGETYFILLAIIQHFLHYAVSNGMIRFAFGGMHHITGLLVDDKKVLVLKNN